MQFAALEYRGLAQVSPVDGVASGRSSGSTAIDAGTLTVTASEAVLVGWIYSTGTVSLGTPGFAVRSRINADLAQDRLSTGPGTYTVTGANASSQSWTMQVVGFRAGGGVSTDAGGTDGGALDGGASLDAGAKADAGPDAGRGPDAGNVDAGAGDGGPPGDLHPGEYVVGCGCQAPGAGGAAVLGWLAACGAAAWRRAARRRLSAPR